MEAERINQIETALADSDEQRALALKWVLRDFVLQHPACEQRHRVALHATERRILRGVQP